jgi:hypothetical protein
MKDKEKYRTKSKEIWYETTKDRKKRKSRYPLGFRQHNNFLINLEENLTWIIILVIFIIGLILLWEWLV